MTDSVFLSRYGFIALALCFGIIAILKNEAVDSQTPSMHDNTTN